jgi:CBS domain containing-hemolysin-like protein
MVGDWILTNMLLKILGIYTFKRILTLFSLERVKIHSILFVLSSTFKINTVDRVLSTSFQINSFSITNQPRPIKGCFVGITVISNIFAWYGRSAIARTQLLTSCALMNPSVLPRSFTSSSVSNALMTLPG